jgi:hypothetical protein
MRRILAAILLAAGTSFTLAVAAAPADATTTATVPSHTTNGGWIGCCKD